MLILTPCNPLSADRLIRHSELVFLKNKNRTSYYKLKIRGYSTQRIGHGNMRPRILLTLSHREKGDRAKVTPREIVNRVVEVFECQQIIISDEPHRDGGAHFHVGILNSTATRYNAARLLRDAFPEFVGASLNVSFHKAWETIVSYVFKGTLVLSWSLLRGLIENPGELDFEHSRGKPQLLSRTEELFEILASKKSWEEVVPTILRAALTLRSIQSL